jgi:tetratricopeptide (TPR) repeat protein
MSSDKCSVADQARHVWDVAEQLAARVRIDSAWHHRSRFDLLDHDFPNIRTSQRYLVTQSGRDAARLIIVYVETLSSYLRQRGFNGELKRWCDDALRAAEDLGQDTGSLFLLRSEAQSALGQWDQAIADIQAAIDASEGKEGGTHARSVLALGRLQLNQGAYQLALGNLNRAQTLLYEQGDITGIAIARSELAAYHLNRRELDKALALYLEVDELNKQAGATETTDHTLLMLGVVHQKRREYERAREYLKRLLVRGQERGNRGAEATAAHHLAWGHLYSGQLQQAEALCGQALQLYEAVGDLRGASDGYEQLGLIALARGRKAEALAQIERSLTLRNQLGNQEGAAASLRRLAIVRMRMGHLGRAVHHLLQSLTTYQRLGVLSLPRFATILGEFWKWGLRRKWTK